MKFPNWLTIIVATVFFPITIIFFRTAKGRGILGEFWVKRAIGKNELNVKYVINNITVVNEGKSCQIDHLIISRSGIFVIETKNYSGRIYGQENQREWTQVLAYGKSKKHFYNPILQNHTHIYHLSKIIGRNDCFISIVVFPKAKLMTNNSGYVGDIQNLKKVYKSGSNIVFTADELNDIYNKLLDIKNNPQVTMKEHVKSIEQMKQNIENNICPRCGKELILRQGQHGSFYGCSGYPQCKFTKES